MQNDFAAPNLQVLSTGNQKHVIQNITSPAQDDLFTFLCQKVTKEHKG